MSHEGIHSLGAPPGGAQPPEHPMRRVRFIANPRARGGAPWRALRGELATLVRNAKVDAQICETAAAGHATQLAAEAVDAGFDAVVAIGGDGTMNEVARALVHTSTALGIVPLGSGNGLARHLGLPQQPVAAIAALLSAQARVTRIDTGRVNGRLFCNVMGFGVDAEVSQRFNGMTRRGWPGYLRATWSVLRERTAQRCLIRVAGVEHEAKVLLIAIANSSQYGNDVEIAPGASVSDGQLDLVIIEDAGALRIAELMGRLAVGSFAGAPGVRHFQGAHFEIVRVAAGLVHTDGETFTGEAMLTIAVDPASLRVLVMDGVQVPSLG